MVFLIRFGGILPLNLALDHPLNQKYLIHLGYIDRHDYHLCPSLKQLVEIPKNSIGTLD